METEAILKGIRVLDISTILAAPLTAGLLGDFGAEVIKVEMPGTGDAPRNWGSETWKVTGRNKKCITLDFHKPESLTLLYRLVEISDIVVVNFKPQTLKKWKIDYDDLVKIKSDIIYLHLSAFGRNGPYSGRPGFARIAEAFSGLTYLTGYPDRKPIFAGYPIADALGGVHGAFSLMLALYHSKQTGIGQLIDLALYEPLVRVMESYIVDYSLHGKINERVGTFNPEIAPNDLYETKDSRWIVIPASTESMFRRLMLAIYKPELREDPRFVTNERRVANRAALDQYINIFFKQHEYEALSDILMAHEVAFGKVNNVEDLFHDPHIRERGNLVSVHDKARNQQFEMQGIVPMMSATPGEVKWPGPEVGAHNREIYKELLGIPDEEIDELHQKGVI